MKTPKVRIQAFDPNNSPTTPAGLSYQMVTAIKKSRKGQIPPGLAKYLASKKKVS